MLWGGFASTVFIPLIQLLIEHYGWRGALVVSAAAAAVLLRRRAGERLELLAAALEQIGEAVVISRADGTIAHANAAFLRSAGYARQNSSTSDGRSSFSARTVESL